MVLRSRVGPTVEYGVGSIHATPQIIEDAGARMVLLVCGERSFEASGAAEMLPRLGQVAEVARWSDFAPNTDAADLVRGLRLVRDLSPDLVLGVGGGSAMDMAKLLAAYATIPDDDGVLAAIRSGSTITERSPGLVLAPTTSGSGSESTHFAVVYLGADKFSIGGPGMYADAVVLDPGLARSGSAHQRATSGIDATCQSIESLWAVAATPQSRRLARHALGLLVPAIERFVNRPDDRSSRAMSLGSHLAGRAIDISKTTAAHALSYGITKRYGVSHGHAVALTLGHFIEHHATAPVEQLQPGVDSHAHGAAIETICERLGAGDPRESRTRFVSLLESIGLATRLRDVGLRNDDERLALVASVNVERLGNNPVAFDRDGLLRILEQAG